MPELSPSSGTDGTRRLHGRTPSAAGVARLIAELVAQCLTELNELYRTRATALRPRVDAHA